MNAKRILALLFAVLMVAGCLAACGETKPATTDPVDGTQAATGAQTTFVPWSAEDIADLGANIQKEAAGNKVTLKVWQPEAAQDVFKAQVADFKEIFKDYAEIEIEVAIQGEGDAGANVLSDPNTAADVFGFASDQIMKLAKPGALANVMFPNEVTSMNTPASVEAATYEGNLVAYPEVGDNSYFLCYDKRDITADQAKSLEAILEACKANNKRFIMNTGDGYFACMFLFTGGLETMGLEEDGETQKFNDYDIDQVTASVKAFADLFKTYKANFESNQTSAVVDGFKNGTTSAGVIGSWDVASAKAALGENAGFAILPTININGTDTPIKNMFGYKFIGVNSQTKFPYTAQALAYYLSNEECQQERAEQLEWGPSNINVANSDFVTNNESMSAILAQATNSVPQTIIVGTFWDPCAALGTYITESSNDFSEANVKAEVEKCINNILDL
ncbi:MAG: extracellular solute-binding protein [Ruminococcus sp.]|nr:extracellular solute-binding protein [Ruminococcus sp.]